MPQNNSSGRIYDILVIEDNPADARLLEIAWAECPVAQTRVQTLELTKDVLLYLRGGEPYHDRPHPVPDLIMLDYVMPIDGGLSLVQLKGDPVIQVIPVIVLTGAPTPDILREVYQRHANACLAKPHDLPGFLDLICFVAEHWLKRVVLPPKPVLKPERDGPES